MGRPPTMADIARAAGVSRVAVSYALNDRPGVSPEVRDRIRKIAEDLGFRASGPARSLHGARPRAIGMTMLRPAKAFHVEVFRREFISGAQAELSSRGYGLALQFVADPDAELSVYSRWSAEQRVSGVIVSDVLVADPRPAFLAGLGLPAVAIGGPLPSGDVTCLWSGDTEAIAVAVQYLAGLGHRRIARVSGPEGLLHTAARTNAFLQACTHNGIEGTVLTADYTGEDGARATRRLLSGGARPTAILYDNDVMAVAGLGVATEMGVAVPAELSLVAWEDSPVCQVVRPALTVLKRDLQAYGAHAVRLLFQAIEGESPVSVRDHTAQLVVRSSTGRAAPGS